MFLPEVKGIDPSLFFDENKAYVVYNSDPPDNKPLYEGHRSIKIYELDLQRLHVVGEEKMLVNGGVDLSKKPVWIEGPHLIKTRGWSYFRWMPGSYVRRRRAASSAACLGCTPLRRVSPRTTRRLLST